MKTPWYQEGLKFECTQCGDCCTGDPGHVWVNPDEIRALAKFLGISTSETRRRYVRRARNRKSLTEKHNGDCVFYDRGCTVYPARPRQCRTFPFWPQNLRSRKSWDEVQEECPGAGQGKLYPLEEIQLIRRGEAEAGKSAGA